MSAILQLVVNFINSLFKAEPSSTKVATVGTDTVTAGDLITALGSLPAYASALQAAIKAKNYAMSAELTVDEALLAAKDTGIGGVPIAVASLLVPLAFDAINSGALSLGSIDDNAGEQQEQDVQSSVGL